MHLVTGIGKQLEVREYILRCEVGMGRQFTSAPVDSIILFAWQSGEKCSQDLFVVLCIGAPSLVGLYATSSQDDIGGLQSPPFDPET